MSRRKLAARKPNGRIYSYVPKDQELLSPTAARRLRDAAMSGLRDPAWATIAGRLHLEGKLTLAEFSAAKKWAAIVADYSMACRSPPPPKTLALDRLGGSSIDPDSPLGELEVARHEAASARYLAGRNALRHAGLDAERVVDHVCARDEALAGFGELAALRAGLQALSTLWTDRRKAR